MDIQVHETAVPALGYGTFQIKDRKLVDLVANALDLGYRHIDTARMYDNEHLVGEGLQKSGVARDAYFLTTKIQPKEFRHNDLLSALKDSLKKLQTDYVDLTLMHWPNPDVPLEETLGALNEARELGMTRHIGVSNFTTSLLDEAVATSDAPIFMNQIEIHPFLDQTKVIAKCREHGIGVTAYSPLARAEVLGNETLQKIGAKHGKSETQVALRWLLDQSMIAIPKTQNEERQAENFDVFDFELSPAEIRDIASLAKPDGRLIDPSFAPDWDSKSGTPMQRMTADPPSDAAPPAGAGEANGATQYVGGHPAFYWIAALTSAWYFMPAQTWQIAIPALVCGLVAVLFAFVASRSTDRTWPRVAAMLVAALPFVLVPMLRTALAEEAATSVLLQAAIALVPVGVIFVAVDPQSQSPSGTRWIRAVGFSTMVLAAFVGVMSAALFEGADDGWLYVHVLAAPAFVVFCWYLATRIPHLRWLFTAIMLGVALPVVAMMNMASFAFLGGIGFVMYVVLQTAFVFVSERFLRTA